MPINGGMVPWDYYQASYQNAAQSSALEQQMQAARNEQIRNQLMLQMEMQRLNFEQGGGLKGVGASALAGLGDPSPSAGGTPPPAPTDPALSPAPDLSSTVGTGAVPSALAPAPDLSPHPALAQAMPSGGAGLSSGDPSITSAFQKSDPGISPYVMQGLQDSGSVLASPDKVVTPPSAPSQVALPAGSAGATALGASSAAQTANPQPQGEPLPASVPQGVPFMGQNYDPNKPVQPHYNAAGQWDGNVIHSGPNDAKFQTPRGEMYDFSLPPVNHGYKSIPEGVQDLTNQGFTANSWKSDPKTGLYEGQDIMKGNLSKTQQSMLQEFSQNWQKDEQMRDAQRAMDAHATLQSALALRSGQGDKEAIAALQALENPQSRGFASPGGTKELDTYGLGQKLNWDYLKNRYISGATIPGDVNDPSSPRGQLLAHANQLLAQQQIRFAPKINAAVQAAVERGIPEKYAQGAAYDPYSGAAQMQQQKTSPPDGQLAKPVTKADRDALPIGTRYMNPDGTISTRQ